MKHTRPSLCLSLCIILLLPVLLIPLAGCGKDQPIEQNAVLSVTHDKKSEELVIRIGLTDAFLNKNESRLYLFELPAGTTDLSDLSGFEPVTDVAVRSGSITIRISDRDGVRSRLFSSFVPAAYDKLTAHYNPIAPAAALVSGTADADDRPARPIKSLALADDVIYDVDAVGLGVSSVVIGVRLDRMILESWEEDAVPCLWNATTRWLRGSEVRALDERVSCFTSLGIRVYLRLLLGYDEDCACPDILYCPGAANDAGPDSLFAVNMTDPAAADIMEGFLCWLVQRYAADGSEIGRGLCRDLLLGDAVNLPGHACAGSLTAEEQIANYERLLRLADNALTLYAPAGGAFADIAFRPAVKGASGQDYLQKLAAAALTRGDFNWNLSGHIDAATPAAWLETGSGSGSGVSDGIAHPGDLLDTGRQNLERNNARRLIVTVTVPDTNTLSGADKVNEADQAVSYTYAYVSALAEGRVEALIWGVHRADDDTAALRRQDGTPRKLYETMTVIDAQDTEAVMTAARTRIGADFSAAEAGLAGIPAPAVRVDADALIGKEEYASPGDVITFGDGTLQGFEGCGSLRCLALDGTDGIVRMNASFEPVSKGGPAAVRTILDARSIEKADKLLLPMKVSALGGKSTDVTVTLYRASDGNAASDKPMLFYTYTLHEVPLKQDFVMECDISGLTGQLDNKDELVMTILVEPADGKFAVTYDLSLEAVRATGVRHSTFLIFVLIGAGIVLLAALAFGVYTLLHSRWFRRMKDLLFKKPVKFDYE